MTDKDKLDELYKNRFNDFELPVSDELMSNLKQELNIQGASKTDGYWKWIGIIGLSLTNQLYDHFCSV